VSSELSSVPDLKTLASNSSYNNMQLKETVSLVVF